MYESKHYKAINKDCITAEDIVAAAPRSMRKLEFWSLINCCCSPEKFFHTVKMEVNVSKENPTNH